MCIYFKINKLKRIIIKTEDGSSSLYVPEIDEHFHSVHGAITESLHVFIHKGLRNICLNNINVLEIGFGTGLNCILTYRDAQTSKKSITYHSVELYPISKDEFDELNYCNIIGVEYQNVFQKMHSSPWGIETQVDDFFYLKKIQNNLLDVHFDSSYDLIYFDAFAPGKQPEMWTYDIFKNISDSTKSGGILTTYCAKGEVRRILKSVGFDVVRTDGPPGKREMIIATKL